MMKIHRNQVPRAMMRMIICAKTVLIKSKADLQLCHSICMSARLHYYNSKHTGSEMAADCWRIIFNHIALTSVNMVRASLLSG